MGIQTSVSVPKVPSLFESGQMGLCVWKKAAIRVLASSAAVVFGGAILLMSILAVSDPVRVRPNTETLGTTLLATAEAKPKVMYYLPYPGILPDSPLYKLKAIRDRVTLWFTFSGEKKAWKQLQFGDKRVNAGLALVEGSKSRLGVATITKAEKYMESAVKQVETATKMGQDEKSLALELAKALPKHVEVIEGLVTKVEKEDEKSLNDALLMAKMLNDRIDQVLREAK
jgi:hypothetical protein